MEIVLFLVVIIVVLGFRTSGFTCFHKWEYIGNWGITYQQKKCKKCNKLKIISQ